MFSRGMQGSTYPGLPCTPLRVHQCLQMHKCTLTLTPPNHTCATAFPFSILSLNTLYCGGGGMMIQTMTWWNSGKRRARRNGSGKHNICYHSVYPSECFFYEFDANILREIFSQLSGHKNISRCLNLLLIVRNQEAKKKHTVKGDSGFNKLILHAAEWVLFRWAAVRSSTYETMFNNCDTYNNNHSTDHF